MTSMVTSSSRGLPRRRLSRSFTRRRSLGPLATAACALRYPVDDTSELAIALGASARLRQLRPRGRYLVDRVLVTEGCFCFTASGVMRLQARLLHRPLLDALTECRESVRCRHSRSRRQRSACLPSPVWSLTSHARRTTMRLTIFIMSPSRVAVVCLIAFTMSVEYNTSTYSTASIMPITRLCSRMMM